jgi:hypothetical protein
VTKIGGASCSKAGLKPPDTIVLCGWTALIAGYAAFNSCVYR